MTSPGTTPSASPVQTTKASNVLPSSQTGEKSSSKPPSPGFPVSPSSSAVTSLPPTQIIALRDMIVETIRVIHHFCQYQEEIPREVYPRILLTLQNNEDSSSNSDWSDGSTWIRVLEMGVSRTRKTTILNLLEYMGAWEWYDRQVKLSEGTIRTKRNALVNRRGAAIHVLNELQNTQKMKSIKGVGRLALKEGGRVSDTPDTLPKNCDSISEQVKTRKRENLLVLLNRGSRLKERLVKELGLGILFSPKIW